MSCEPRASGGSRHSHSFSVTETSLAALAALAEALEGPGAQLSPRRTLERIQDALSACKGGDTAQCSVQGQGPG